MPGVPAWRDLSRGNWALPFLYGYLPYWLITCLPIVTFGSALYIGYSPVLGPARTWLGIGLLIGLNYWTSHHLMGSTAGWQLWWTELTILVGLGAIAVSNLYVQGGMKLKYVAWLAFGLAVYDIIFATVLPLTDQLVADPNSMIPFICSRPAVTWR